jgi:hypothetical protein
MRQLFIVILFFSSTVIQAQTKKIAFKSHSGNNENYSIALEYNLFDIGNSNFGNAPQRDVKTAQLDSVIFISDSITFLVTSEYCKLKGQDEKQAKLWQAGKETMYKHPLFSKKHSLDSIKSVIAEQYSFRNPVEKVIFVGYDNKTKKHKKNSIVPFVTQPDENGQAPFGPQFILILCLIIGLSLLGAFTSWWFYRSRKNRSEKAGILPV